MPLIAALDVAYGSEPDHAGLAVAACVRAEDWTSAESLDVSTETVLGAGAYEPGAFYKRELPALLSVLGHAPRAEILIVDGYVWLEGGGRPGLGARLFEAIGGRSAVVGVAKSPMRADEGQGAWSAPVLRGKSATPLRVTSIGLDRAAAAEAVRSMAGESRLPDLLKAADRAARAELRALTA